MKKFLFADLDDTLFQTLRKLPGTDPATLTPMTVNTLGQPHSHATPAQTALLDLLNAESLIQMGTLTPAIALVLKAIVRGRMTAVGIAPQGEGDAVDVKVMHMYMTQNLGTKIPVVVLSAAVVTPNAT